MRQVNWIWLLAASLLLFVSPGCNQEDDGEAAETPVADSRSATEILRTTLDLYSRASSYQDKAVLYLTYRLNGRAIQEPHPWSIAWQDTGEFSADWFNARIRCDGGQFSCYVYDIETGNIDNQQILIPAGSRDLVVQLFDDKIARHFLCGTSELPLDELETEHQNRLVQPLLCFFDSAVTVAWLQQPEHLKHCLTMLPRAIPVTCCKSITTRKHTGCGSTRIQDALNKWSCHYITWIRRSWLRTR